MTLSTSSHDDVVLVATSLKNGSFVMLVGEVLPRSVVMAKSCKMKQISVSRECPPLLTEFSPRDGGFLSLVSG